MWVIKLNKYPDNYKNIEELYYTSTDKFNGFVSYYVNYEKTHEYYIDFIYSRYKRDKLKGIDLGIYFICG